MSEASSVRAGVSTDADGVEARSQPVHVIPRFLPGNPARASGVIRDSPVECGRELEGHKRPAQPAPAMKEHRVLGSSGIGLESHFKGNTHRSEPIGTTLRLRIGIFGGGDDARDPSRDERIDAGRLFALMITGLQRDNDGGTPSSCTGRGQGHRFRVGAAILSMPPFADEEVTLQDHRTDQRVGRHSSPTSPSQG